MSAASPRHTLALALGVRPGQGCGCAVCGPSPFDSAGPRHRAIGTNFTDFAALVDPAADDVCQGCARLMAGRPGDDPPPLRTRSVLVPVDTLELTLLDRAAWWSLLAGELDIPAAGAVLSWATSQKRHHWLHAGISTPERWRAGSDDGTIDWRPDGELAAAIAGVRRIGASKASILTGFYPVRLDPSSVAAAEAVLAPLRGQLILDLAVWAAPMVESIEAADEWEDDLIDPMDSRAAVLIAELVWGSSRRAERGKEFWSGYLLRRLRRFARLPLADLVSRLAGECSVSVGSAAAAAGILSSMSAEEITAVERSIRERTDLIHALAFERVQGIRAERRTEDRS